MVFKRAGNGRFDGRSQHKSGGRDRDGPRFGDRSERGGRSFGSRRELELFDVKCARCGNDTQVPFKPTGEKPVYCRDCFNRGGDDAGPRKSFSRSEPAAGASANDLRIINEKLDKIMQALDIE